MPVWYKDPETGQVGSVEDDFDEQGRNLAQIGLREGKAKSGKRYQTGQMLVANDKSKKPGSQVFVPDEELGEAIKTGKFDLPDTFKAKQEPLGVSRTEATARGVAQGATLGLADEAQAALRAPFSDKTYGQLRDEYRNVDKAAFDERPGYMLAGSVLGGAPIGGGAAMTTGRLAAQGAGLGVVSGFGAGEGDVADHLKMMAGGAALGAAAPYALKAGGQLAGKAADKTAGAVQDSYEYLKGIGGAFREGASKANNSLFSTVEGTLAAKDAIKSAAATSRELADLKKGVNVRPMGSDGLPVSIGAGKIIGKEAPIDDLTEALLSPETNRVKEFVATKAAGIGADRRDPKMILRALQMGVDRRNAARDWNAKESAKRMAPRLEALQERFATAKSSGFEGLQGKAASEFDGGKNAEQIGDILGFGSKFIDGSDGAEKSAYSLIPAKNQREIGMALEVIENGAKNIKGLEGFSSTRFAGGDNQELFRRLQFARQLIDEQRDFFAKNGQSTAEREMMKFRDKIDAALKTADSKVKADELYSQAKQIEDRLFGRTEFRNPDGRTEVDEFKIARLFGDNDNAGRFGNAIEEAREFVKSNRAFETDREDLLALLDDLDAERSLAADKRLLEAMSYREGPSSPAINLQNYLMNRAKLPADAIGNPTGFLNSADRFLQQMTGGRPWEKVPQDEKRKILRLYQWQKANPRATMQETDAMAEKIFGGKK